MPQSGNEKRQHKLKTPFVTVPTVDWSAVTTGAKTEFRLRPGIAMPLASNLPFFPILIVAYARFRMGRLERLMVLEDSWMEPLRAITPDSLAREGFETLAQFKRYWNLRNRSGYRPLANIIVVRVRPLRHGDFELIGERLVEHFWGEWTEDAQERLLASPAWSS